ncbi:MAG: extracellular solute-binding protein [Lachnospiraceae bacterium]|nr:extracellular solute-binding protein [Lachnospiraceae bacterium]
MKNLKVKKILCSIIAGTLIAGMLGGCGAEEQKESAVSKNTEATESQSTEAIETTEELKLGYPIEGNVELTITMMDEANVSTNYKNLAETPFGKAWQEQTGITLKHEYLADKDAMNLLFASGELPDIIMYNFNNYSGGIAAAVRDGIVLPITDYVEYAPDLMAALESSDGAMKGNMTDDGEIIGFPFIRLDERLCTSRGLIIREDWLEDVNMEIPQTPEDLYNVLKAFKGIEGVTYPFAAGYGNLLNYGIGEGAITSPFGLPCGNFYQIDGKVHYGFAEPELKDVLVYLHKLYEEELLDPNMQSLSANLISAAMTGGTGGLTFGATSKIGEYLKAMAEVDPTYSVTGVGSLVAKEGDTAMSSHYTGALAGVYAVITPDCKNVEAAVRFLNYGYTEAGDILMNWGIEGESYEVVNGEKQWTDWVNNNPDGWTAGMAKSAYSRGASNGPMVQEYRKKDTPQQEDATTRWANSNAADYVLPSLSIPGEDASEYSKISGDITTYYQEMIVKYITGEESLDTFESAYLATLEKMGVKRMIEIQQKALDAYNAR